MKRFLVVPALVGAIALAMTGCGSGDDDKAQKGAGGGGALPDTLTLGYDAALSGFLAPFDGLVTNGSKLAVRDINAKGGIDGKVKLKLDIRDMKSDTATVVAVAQELIDAGASVLLPGCNTDFQVAAASVAQRKDVLMLSPCNADPAIPGRFPVYFPVGVGGNRQAAAGADFIKSEGHKNVYLLNAPDFLFVKLMTKYFRAAAPSRGLTVTKEDTFKVGQTDFGPQVAKIQNASPKPDVIYTGMFAPDIAVFVKQLRAAGVDTPVVGTDGADTEVTLKTGGAAVNGLSFTTFGFPTKGSATEKLYAEYRKAYGKDPDGSYAALGYDAIQVLAAAVQKAQSVDPQVIADTIQNGLEVDGVLGKVVYAKDGDKNPIAPVAVVTVKNGRFALADEINPTDVPAP